MRQGTRGGGAARGEVGPAERGGKGLRLAALGAVALGVALAWVLLLAVPPAVAQQPTPAPTPVVYVVQRGDTLSAIAERFGTTVRALVEANDIANPSLIVVGQRLVIPGEGAPPAPVVEEAPYRRVHPVRPGETLPFLAFRYGTTPLALRQANELHRLGILLPGLPLAVPAPSAATASTPAFPEIVTRPSPVVQGQTMAVLVQGGGEMELSGSFLGQALHFGRAEEGYWAVVGVGALTRPGAYPLRLEAVERESGDLLAMEETLTVTAGSFVRYNIVVPPGRTSLLDPTLGQEERKKLDAVLTQVSGEKQWAGLFDLPLKGEVRVTSPFGQRRSYNGGPVSSYHTGIDYGADTGVEVFAPITGTVALAEPLQVRGLAVILDHGLGVYTGFWHLSQIDVEPGQVVGRGERVGLVGDTGLSTGPHLHWEMRVANVPVDPLQWTQQILP
jgi:murein DD-endopeptidase MepM/ murein hydrolase activator NlpD